MISILINLKDNAGLTRHAEPVSVGVPFAKGALRDLGSLTLIDTDEKPIPLQIKQTAIWPDGSIRWILLDFQVCLCKGESKTLKLQTLQTLQTLSRSSQHSRPCIDIKNTKTQIHLNTGNTHFVINKNILGPFDKVIVKNNQLLSNNKSRMQLIDKTGITYAPIINEVSLENDDQKLKSTIKLTGFFKSDESKSLAAFISTMTFYAGSALVKWNFTLHNPRAATHPEGIWDLGDSGSIFFKDLSTYLPINNIESSWWKEQSDADWRQTTTDTFSLYQDSSGGDNWKGNNHKNRFSEVTHKFNGYRCYSNNNEIDSGLRASPFIHLKHSHRGVTVHLKQFWQNFPKAIEINKDELVLRLFPINSTDSFELQGGERKTHTVFFDFEGEKESLDWTDAPLIPELTYCCYAQSGVFPYMGDENRDDRMDLLVNTGITGKGNFFEKREVVDEYGWRNFGDLYADHETPGHKGNQALVSHYNNQYDPLFGFTRQFVTTGNPLWFELMEDLAQHITDIDIYHTLKDRGEFNGGLFWHTDHYLDASTCTHRTYSRDHLGVSLETVGGGPANEHCYTTGLLYHYYLTGSESSKEAVLTLTDWIIKLHEGTGSLLEWLQSFIKTDIPAIKKAMLGEKIPGYKYPLHRGTGNYINTLIDAYLLTADKNYVQRIEAIIQLTIHPNDDINDRKLEIIESSWSYTIFLQALVKYLDLKETLGEQDPAFFYAKDSLLHYTSWMLEHEYPFLDKPNILDYPNHTWAAQDIRKANIFYFAYKYSNNKETYLKKANYFYDYVVRELANSDTRSFSRILAILLQNRGPHEYFSGTFQQKDHTVSEPCNYAECPSYNLLGLLANIFGELWKKMKGFSLSREINWLNHRSQHFAKLFGDL